MGSTPIAKIVSYNLYGERICASAAKISTTVGNSLELFDLSDDADKNRKLIKKVLNSGHASLIEHAVFTIAFANVSAFAEQFFIECRLASFTVKSRRYVDFSGLGYYVPDGLDRTDREFYLAYMDMLFTAYKSLLEMDIPKEDARFLLPYSFSSNFYCTLNARELWQVIHSIEYGRGQGIQELQELAGQLKQQLNTLFPSLSFEDNAPLYQFNTPVTESPRYEATTVEAQDAGKVNLLHTPTHPLQLLETAYQISNPSQALSSIGMLLKSSRPRELEQLAYTFYISDVTLAGITHFVRHRMQSIIVPPLRELRNNRQIIPASVQRNSAALAIYRKTIIESCSMRTSMYSTSELAKFHYYFICSGNLTDIITTMNARELAHFIQLRTCNRAQWEIRGIAIRMLNAIRDSFPDLFNMLGPSCYVKGYCPEGRMTCGKKDEVIKLFSESLIDNKKVDNYE